MSQEDYAIADQAGTPFLTDLNNHLLAIVSNNSGATAPSTTFAYQWWADTTTGLLKIRNAANSAWVTVGTLASAYMGLLPLTGGTVTGGLTISGAAFTPSQTSGIVGTTTNNDANAGSVGEVISSTVTSGSAVALTSSVQANVTSISLTAGDWDVYGNVIFLPAATTNVTSMQGSVSMTSATVDTVARFIDMLIAGQVTGAIPSGYTAPPQRISIGSTTIAYLVAVAGFTVSTMAAYGRIWARRAR